MTSSNGDDHGQSPENWDLSENLSRNSRDGVEERQRVFIDSLLQDVERDRMEAQVFLLARTTRQRINSCQESESEINEPR